MIVLRWWWRSRRWRSHIVLGDPAAVQVQLEESARFGLATLWPAPSTWDGPTGTRITAVGPGSITLAAMPACAANDLIVLGRAPDRTLYRPHAL